MKKSVILNPQLLRKKYLEENLSVKDLHRFFKVSRGVILKNLKANNVKKDKEQIKEKKKQTWHGKTEEEKLKIAEKWKQTMNNKPEAEKQKRKEKIKEKMKQVWNNKTEEKKQKIKDKLKENWNNKTEKEKQKIKEKIKEKNRWIWNNKTEEEKQKIKEKREQTFLEKYGYERSSQNEEIKEKIKQTMNNKTEEEKQKIRDKIKESLNNKTEEEKQEIRAKIKKTFWEKYGCENVAQNEKIRQKIKRAWNSKTEEEKLKVIEKQKQTYLEHFEQGLIKPSFTSKPEMEIKEFLEELGFKEGIDFKKNKSVLKGEELDIYLPNYNIAIEFNGYRFHNSTKQEYQLSKLFPTKPQNYHFQKYQSCKELNIRLISIWDIDWTYNPLQRNKIESVLKSFLEPELLNKIYARKTTIKEIDYQTYKVFCNNYHLQNSRMAKIRYGLFYNNELIQIMSFGKVYNNGKENKEIEYELIRNCIKDNYIVVGGTERLFKHFIKRYNPQSILTYSDNDFFTGDSYSRLGFNFIGETGPSLFWVDRENKIKLYRNPFKNKEYCKLEKQGKLLRCYGCGSKKFIWKNKEYLQK